MSTTTLPPTPTSSSVAPLGQRTGADRPGEVTGNHVKFIYVLPLNGNDRHLDVNGILDVSVGAFQEWLSGQTPGRVLRVDTYQGALDIAFVRTHETDEETKARGAYVRDYLEDEIIAAGFHEPGVVYGVYYDGGSTWSCGGGAWPPTLPGIVGALYLNGLEGQSYACGDVSFATSINSPGYLEFAMLHELLHTLGFVASCAPNHEPSGHVSDDPTDLMYAGDQPWAPAVLDKNHDDYFMHSNGACLDLDDSPFLTS